MKKLTKLGSVLALLAVLLFMAGCAMPSPLFGTWADNRGNTLSFFADDTFNARIHPQLGMPPRNYSGSFNVLLNTLTLNDSETGQRIVTEWDIRGNILYLGWVLPEGGTLNLTLFKVSN